MSYPLHAIMLLRLNVNEPTDLNLEVTVPQINIVQLDKRPPYFQSPILIY